MGLLQEKSINARVNIKKFFISIQVQKMLSSFKKQNKQFLKIK
jgi:hypothetical protein